MGNRKRHIGWYRDALIGVTSVLIYSFVFFSIKSPEMNGLIEKHLSKTFSSYKTDSAISLLRRQYVLNLWLI